MSHLNHQKYLVLLQSQKSLTIAVILICSLLKLWLDTALRIKAESFQLFDDALYVDMAISILNTGWLGDYHNLTLAKGPFYPLWLAFNKSMGLPLLLSQSFLAIIASLVLVRQLFHILEPSRFKWPLLIALYLLCLFNPFIEIRVMREGIYSSLTLLVLAGLLNMYHTRNKKRIILLTTSVLLGAAIGVFWLTREEGLWLIPTVILIMGFTLYRLFLELGWSPEFRIRLGIFSIPYVIWAAILLAVSLVNLNQYGVSHIVEQQSESFRAAYGALLRVSHGNRIRYLHVPKSVRKSVYSVSPTFKELEPYIDGVQGNFQQRKDWIGDTCSFYPQTCPDYAGTWLMWVLRNAVSDAGHYGSAKDSDAFYKRLALEINQACSTDQLECEGPYNSTIPVFRAEYIQPLIETFVHGIATVLSVPVRDYVYGAFAFSKADRQGALKFQQITNNRIIPAYANIGDSQNSLKNRDRQKLEISGKLTKAYKVLVPILCGLTAVAMLISTFSTIVHRNLSFLYVFNLGILGALLGRMLILTYIDVTMFPTFDLWPSYITPIYPLLLILPALALADILAKFNVWQKESSA